MRTKKNIVELEITEIGTNNYSIKGGAVVSRKMVTRLLYILLIMLVIGVIVGSNLDATLRDMLLEHLQHLLVMISSID